MQGLQFWLFKGRVKVSSGTVKWYRSNYGTDFDSSEIASPVWLYSRNRLLIIEGDHIFLKPTRGSRRAHAPCMVSSLGLWEFL